MAYIKKIDEQDEDKRMTLAGQGVSSNSQESEAQSPLQTNSQTGALGTADVNAAKGTVGSGAFTNLSKYIQANKPQAQSMASGITKNVGSQSQQLRTDLSKKQEQFQTQTNPEIQRLQAASGNIANTINKAGISDQAATPTELKQQEGITGLTDEQAKAFQQLYNKQGAFQQYQSPDLSNEAVRAKALQNLANASKTSAGRTQLLQGMYSSPTYSRGQSALDNLLLQGDKNVRQNLVRGVEQQTQGLSSDVEANKKAALQRIADIQSQASTAQTEAKSALDTANQTLQDQLNTKLQNDYLTNLQNTILQQGGMTQAQLDQLKSLSGLNDTRTYGVNLQDYFDPNKNPNVVIAPTISQVASNADYQRSLALAKLAGLTDSSYIPDISAVGTREDIMKNSLSGLTNTLSAAKQAYESELAKPKSMYERESGYTNKLSDLYAKAQAARGNQVGEVQQTLTPEEQAFWNQFTSATDFFANLDPAYKRAAAKETPNFVGYSPYATNRYTGERVNFDQAMAYQQAQSDYWKRLMDEVENKYGGNINVLPGNQ